MLISRFVPKSLASHWRLASTLLALSSLAMGGCTTKVTDGGTGGSGGGGGGVGVGTADLRVDWTIESTSTTTICGSHGVQNISIQLTDATTGGTTSYLAACGSFTYTIPDLPNHAFNISATLVDVNNQPLTTAATASLTLSDFNTNVAPFNFPTTSFLGTPATGTGWLEVDWTVESSTYASYCDAHGASAISIQVNNSSGVAQGAPVNVECSDFMGSISLPPGTYSVQAHMIDAAGQTISTTVSSTNLVTVTANTSSTPVFFDFPANSFTSTTPVTGTGSIEVDWTIDSVASGCSTYGAASVAIQLYDSNDEPYGTSHLATCSAFTSTVINLEPGSYSVSAQMVDASGIAVSTATRAAALDVSAGQVRVQRFDFPGNSFYAPTALGAIEIDWTIGSAMAASDCSLYGAANLEIELYDSYDHSYGTSHLAPCTSFVSTVSSLLPGKYTVSARMVDAAGVGVSTTTRASAINVTSGATTVQRFDFPISSFYTATTAGDLEIDWTIESTTLASECTNFFAKNLRIQLYDASGYLWDQTYYGSCSSFTKTIVDVPAGAYTVTAEMVDSTGAVVSTTSSATVTVPLGSKAVQAFDFPATSFYTNNPTGDIVVDWTISSTVSSSLCTAYGAAYIELKIYDTTGVLYGTAYHETCSRFSMTIGSLPPGTYDIGAQMLSASSTPVSTAIPPVTVYVYAGRATIQDFNFPSSSFY